MKLFNPFRSKPTPSPQVLDVAAAKRRAEERNVQVKADAQKERDMAIIAYAYHHAGRNTQRQREATERLRRATDRGVELGV